MSKAGRELVGHSGNDSIGTPRPLWNWLHRRFALTYDAAAEHENAKCYTYSTVNGTFRMEIPMEAGQPAWVEIDRLNGLEQEWTNRRVFVNPPYSKPLCREFIEKAIEERNEAAIVVMLVRYDSSTTNGGLLRDYFHLEYLPRIQYEGQTHPATFASVIAIVRPDAPHNGEGE